MTRTITLVLAALLGCAVALTATAQTLPYEGTLERDGAAENRAVWMEIAITRDGYTGPICWNTPTDAWTIGWLEPVEPPCYTTLPFQVTPTAGAFAVEIGAECPADPESTGCGNTTLAGYPWVLGDAAVTLSLRVVRVEDVTVSVGETLGVNAHLDDMVELAGGQRLINRQQLGYAVSNPAADGFVVDGAMQVGRLGVNRAPSTTDTTTLAIDGDVYTNGDVRVDDILRTGIPSIAGYADGDIASTSDIFADNNITAGGTMFAEHIRSDDDMAVDDDLTVGGELTALNNDWGDGSGPNIDCAWLADAEYTDTVYCPEGQFIAAIELETSASGSAYRVRCCYL